MARDLDNSYVGPYLDDWLKYIRESNQAGKNIISNDVDFYLPFVGVQPDTVRVIFVISERFGVEPHAKHLAVHLMDRYVGLLFWQLVQKHCPAGEIDEPAMHRVRETVQSQTKLILATCLFIATKVDLFKTGLTVSQVRDLMQSIEPERSCSKSSILCCEARILKALDFRMPVCLPIDALELLLAVSELNGRAELRDTCLHLLDMAYLRHEQLFQQLHLMARGSRYDKSSPDSRDFLCLESDVLFIGAAVVVCSNFFFHLRKKLVERLASKLAKLVDVDAVDINIMANILFTYALDEADFKQLGQNKPPRPSAAATTSNSRSSSSKTPSTCTHTSGSQL